MAVLKRHILFHGEGLRISNGEPLRFQIYSATSPAALARLENHLFITRLRRPGYGIDSYRAKAPPDLGLSTPMALRVCVSPAKSRFAEELSGAEIGSLAVAERGNRRRPIGSSFISRLEADFGPLLDHPLVNLIRAISDYQSVSDSYARLEQWLERMRK
ncbi:hypothetical protein HY988_07120 [Candidatus Micrarchaeota archaeon]|nr:hypothetical protein [Candidatus Micrarchaeota archaeon]